MRCTNDFLQPFALLPSAVAGLVQMVAAEMSGQSSEHPAEPYVLSSADADPVPMSDVISGAASGSASPGMVAVIPLVGTLSPNGRYGGTSLDGFARAVRQADASPNISTIMLHITSPGGTVTGTPEAADAVREVRTSGKTRIVAFADGMMASAATWIGTAADEVVLTPSGEAGSVGVITVYAEISQMLADAGYKVDVIRNPSKKARFTGFEPLTDEMRAHLETMNMAAYEKFKRAMADNRKVRIDSVENKFGGGEMLDSDTAKAAGLVDRVDTFDHTLSRLLTRPARKAPASYRAALQIAEII